MAQPPLSMQIKTLEDELGAALFVRDKRRVFLTQAGQALLGRAQRLLQDASAAREATREAASGGVGRLALGYTASAMFTARLPAAIRRFRAACPQVALVLHEMTSLDQLDALDARSLDVGLLRKPEVSPPEGVQLQAWYHAPLVVALPRGHRLAGQAALAVADLRDEPLITYPRQAGIGLYWPILRLCTKAGFRPQVVQEAREPSVMVGLVCAGVGLAIVPADTACIQLDGVAYVPLRDPDAVSTLWLASRTADANDRLLAPLLQALQPG
jgi:DNA-binding transcriptional LysR family regulator